MRPKIIKNRIRCRTCGDLLESVHTHDFKQCSCKKVAIDGGGEYLKRLGDPADYEELSEKSDALNIEIIESTDKITSDRDKGSQENIWTDLEESGERSKGIKEQRT